MQTDLEYRIDMKKEKNFSETDFQKKALENLSDDEILQGFKDADARIVREYYYGYCRVAYCIYDKRYDLQHKPGMDFFSLAHEYYLYLCEHDFKPLEDRKPSMSLKTWMVNGFRFLLLDKLKEVVKEHRFESFEARQESRKMQFDVTDNQFEHDLYQTIEDIGNFYYGRDSKNSIILKMLYIEGFRGKDVAAQLGISHSAVTQRCQKMMHDVVIPYIKRYFDASEYGSYLSFAEEDTCIESAPKMSMPRMMSECKCCEESADKGNNIFNNKNNMEEMKKGRITPRWIDSLKERDFCVWQQSGWHAWWRCSPHSPITFRCRHGTGRWLAGPELRHPYDAGWRGNHPSIRGAIHYLCPSASRASFPGNPNRLRHSRLRSRRHRPIV